MLPLVPGYLSTISGVSFADIQEGRGRAKVLGPALLFCLSFTVMFVALGMSATGLGQTLNEHRALLRQISGVVLIALMGVLFIGTLFVPLFNREWRPEQLMRRAHTGGPLIAGLAFAIAWLPCTGPTLGAILTAASTEDTVAKGGVLLAFYALGLAVPFLLSALAFTTVLGGLPVLPQPLPRDHVRLRRDPDRDGRAALHERADPAQHRRAERHGRPRHQLLQLALSRSSVGMK